MDAETRLDDVYFVVIELGGYCGRAGVARPLEGPVITASPAYLASQQIGQGKAADLIAAAQKKSRQPWQQIVSFLYHVLTERFGIKAQGNRCPVCVAIPANFSRNDETILSQLLFEHFGAPGIFFAPAPLMTLYGFGSSNTALVIDIGHTSTSVTPVVDGIVQEAAKCMIPLAGAAIHAYLGQLLQKEGLPHDAPFLRYLLEDTDAVQVAQDPAKRHAGSPHEITYNEQKYTIGESRLLAADILFDPTLMPSTAEGMSLIDAMAYALQHLTITAVPEIRPVLLNNVALTGGCAHLKGLQQRIELELTRKDISLTAGAPDHQVKEVSHLEMPKWSEALTDKPWLATWTGAAVAAKLAFTDTKKFHTRSEFEKHGASVVHQPFDKEE